MGDAKQTLPVLLRSGETRPGRLYWSGQKCLTAIEPQRGLG